MKLGLLATLLGCAISEQDGEKEIASISSPDNARSDSITFLSDRAYLDMVISCKAIAVIVPVGVVIPGKVNLTVKDPYLGYAKVALLFEDTTPLYDGPVDATAVIDKTADLDPTVYVGPLCVIGNGVVIKDNTIIGARCVIEKNTHIGMNCRIDSGAIIRHNTQIGNRVIIQSGAVIGSEGFGNAMENGCYVRIPCFGNVVIEDDVEIGANTTIDRGNFNPTIIRKGARLDNLIMIAHNVEIGEHTALAAQVGISGSTTVGKWVMIAGQAGLAGHLQVGDKAFIGGQAGVSKDVLAGQRVTGYPARDLKKVRRIEAIQLSLPEMKATIKKLQQDVEDLKKDAKKG
jgi:UDP-3-O-[3-hydroxymyristoyl] glucosamine N-acyltransferase